MQGDWIVKTITDMKAAGKTSMDADAEAEKKWAQDIHTFANASLLPTTKSVSELLPDALMRS
jgi:hypothetical protein